MFQPFDVGFPQDMVFQVKSWSKMASGWKDPNYFGIARIFLINYI